MVKMGFPGIPNLDKASRCCFRYLLMLLLAQTLVLLTGCSKTPFSSVKNSVKNLAKSDIDFVADAHYASAQRILRELNTKLYRRNPVQLTHGRVLGGSSAPTAASREQQLFRADGPLVFDELGGRRGTRAMELALAPEFEGDRVFALMAGLTGMVRHSYDYRAEFFMLDNIDEQKLYQSARNVEILLWRLSRAHSHSGQPLILTNHRSGEVDNLSFERLFGKLIATQDMLAEIAAQKNNRLINQVAHNAASLVFFPL
ncbi:MAG: hypothetical protein V7721_03185 [Porticoccaceae bacterium]